MKNGEQELREVRVFLELRASHEGHSVFGVEQSVELCELLGEIVVWKEAAGVSLRDLRRIVGETVVPLESIFVSQEVEQQVQLVSHEGGVVVLVLNSVLSCRAKASDELRTRGR